MNSNLQLSSPEAVAEYETLLLMSRIADTAFTLLTAITVVSPGQLRIRRFEISFAAETAPHPLAERLINVWGKPVHVRYEPTVPGEFRVAAQVELDEEKLY
jgi:hypothetical protein